MPAGILNSVLGIKLKNEVRESKKKEQQWSRHSENMTCKEELENFPVPSSTKGKQTNKKPHKTNNEPPLKKPNQTKNNNPKNPNKQTPKNPQKTTTSEKEDKKNTTAVSKHDVFLQEEKWLTILWLHWLWDEKLST